MRSSLIVMLVGLACSPAFASKAALEQGYAMMCGPQALRSNPSIAYQCRQLRAQIDTTPDDDAGGGAANSLSGGASPDFSLQATYERNCVPVPRVTQRECDALARRLGYAGGGVAGRSATGNQDGSGVAEPVDENNRPCISQVGSNEEHLGAQRTVTYAFRNGCNATIFVHSVMNHSNGRKQRGATAIEPGKTAKVYCIRYANGSGCESMEGYSANTSGTTPR